MENSSLHFLIHPSVVYQLGESLISDAMQAIIELVKNSYDADSSYSKIVIDTQGITKPDNSYFRDEEGGIITIEDDGCGMNMNDIERGWLTISNRHKLEIKRKKETTQRGRTPLGDKGLGRLGVQKLGKNIEIFTKREEEENGCHIGFSWNDFSNSEKIENVKIRAEEFSSTRPSGTKIIISGLMEPELWKNERKGQKNKQTPVIDRLKNELSRLISPYKEIRDFAVYIEIDNQVIDLIEISDSIRNNALLKYQIKFDGKKLSVIGNVKLNYFRPTKKNELNIFKEIVEKDGGIRFFEYLNEQKFAKSYKLAVSKKNRWFISFVYSRTFSELDTVEYIDTDKIANPGSFFGEVDAFNLNFKDDEEQHAFDQSSEFRQIIKVISGIRVYRDGFEIKVDQDWLGLGKQQTTGGSYYGLRPLNTLGFISLSARDNINLEETTDREGFKNTSHYRNFFLLLQQFVKFTGTIQEDLRRTWNEFRSHHNESISDIDSDTTIGDITYTIKKAFANISIPQDNIDNLKKRIVKSRVVSTEIVESLTGNREISTVLRKRAIDILSEFECLLGEANGAIERMDNHLKELKSLQSLPGIIDERIRDLHRQIEMMYESVALGLIAESLSHEINNITSLLSSRAKVIKVDLAKRNTTDKNMLAFVEYVNSTVFALQKQMSFLSPTLRYVREKRNVIVITDFVNEVKEYFNERWGDNSISLNISHVVDVSFIVKINKGKLIQIIDNLILNSEYWLKEDLRLGKLKKGMIDIIVSRPFIYIFDNGRGIESSIEMTLFEPFVTAKANGRGLGLFIIKQLLASEGCNIELLSERNKNKRLYKFQVDLTGIINE